MSVKVVLAEDEEVLRDQLRDLLAKTWPEARIAAVAENGLEAIQALETHRPEVMFLDIQMPEASGLEVARHASGKCHVVFVTAYDHFAVDAFEEGAVDYVMKPLSTARIAKSVQRVKERLGAPPASMEGFLNGMGTRPARDRPYLRWIKASRGQDIQLMTTEEVLYFQSDMKYTRVVCTDRDGLINKSIKELAGELDPLVFWQVHRSTIVNLGAIESVRRDLDGRVVLRLRDRKELLQVSQPYAHLFRQM